MKLFVWDFHGVLEKDNEKGVMIITNKVLENAGYSDRLSHEDNERFLGLKWYQYFKQLMPRLSREECLKLQSDCFEYSLSHPDIVGGSVKPNEGIFDVLGKIKKSGHRQIIISNTKPSELEKYLDRISIREFFDDGSAIGVNAHETHSTKVDALINFLSDKEFDQIICIGDSISDLELGRSVGATNYYYKHPHRKHDPTDLADYMINDLKKILKEV